METHSNRLAWSIYEFAKYLAKEEKLLQHQINEDILASFDVAVVFTNALQEILSLINKGLVPQ